jgi:uncharacterized protein (DUF885 family)
VRTLLRIATIVVLSACAAAPTPGAAQPAASASTTAVASSSASPPPASAPPADDAEIGKAVQAYLDLLVEIHPERATGLGLHARDSELDDRTISGFDKATDREAAMLDALEKKFPAPRASAAAKNDLALLEGALRVDIRTRRVTRPLQRQPDVYVDALDAIFQLIARDFAPAATRAEHVLARIEKLPKTLALAKENLLNPPKVWTEIAIEKTAGAKSFLADQRAFLTSALPGESARIDKALKDATAAFDDYLAYLRRDVMKRSNGRFAAGRELFEYLLANDAFLEENADQLLATGKRLFAKTNDEMTALAKKIDPAAKDWVAVAKKIKGKHPAAPELLASYKKEVSRAREFLVQKDVVSFPPGETLDVIDTPAFMRATTSAAYDPAPAFEERGAKGFFFVTPVDKSLPPQKQEEMLRENDFADIVDTSVHEAYPGHHLQLSFARTNPSKARRAFSHAILEEGWGLYSEELMAELGYYDDEQRLIQLEWTLVRAARVIIDVGLHVGDMTYEQAVKMLTDDVHLERALAVSEARRYTEDPTQPSAYLIGREKILELREKAKQRDGAKFSLKAFHTDLLGRGSIPPSLAAKEMF